MLQSTLSSWTIVYSIGDAVNIAAISLVDGERPFDLQLGRTRQTTATELSSIYAIAHATSISFASST